MARQRPIILDDDDPPPVRQAPEYQERSRDAFEQGLAATLIGAVMLLLGVLAPLALMVLSRNRFDDQYSDRHDPIILIVVIFVGVIAMLLISTVGAILGLRGQSRARRDGVTAAMPIAGTLLSFTAIGVWLLLVLGLVYGL
jgi:hypothetical protein